MAEKKYVVLVNDGRLFPSGGIIHVEGCPHVRAKKIKGKVKLTDSGAIENLTGLGFAPKKHTCV